MATETMRDYLVSVGFRVDEQSFKKFIGGIEASAKAVGGLVAAIEGAALVVGAAVSRFASNMEALYFASQRTGASATNIKAFEKAAQNFGASSEEALGSVEALARYMRNNPGSEGFLQSLGVQTRDVNGKMRDTVDIMADLGREMAKKPQYLANQYAGIFGISENTMLAMRNGEFQKQLEEQRRLLADAGFEKATKDAHEFEIKLRSLQTRIEAIGVQIGLSLIDALGPQMEEAAKWFDKNGKQIGEVVAGIAKGILTAAGFITPILKTIADGWKNVYGWVKLLGEEINKAIPENWSDKIGAGTAWLLEKLGIKDKVDEAIGLNGPTGAAKPSAPASGTEQSTVAYFVSKGWTKEQAAGIVANLKQENSNFDPKKLGDNGQAVGIAQWHPDRQAAFKAQYGKELSQASLQEQLEFVNFELTKGSEAKAGDLLRASKNARQAGEIVSRYYERPGKDEDARAREAANRGASAVQISQTTNINVAGGDAASTGKAVASEQGRVNETLVRNTQSAVS